MSSSIYEPASSHLPDANQYIRLLQIHACDSEDDICCSFPVVNLSSAPQFAALSYTWGKPHPARIIRVDGKAVEVGKNCFHAISQLLQQPGYDLFWIDAICIDQSNLAEKNRQVQMMGRIYAGARVVLVSLGPPNDPFEILVNVLHNAPNDRWPDGYLDAMENEMDSDLVSKLQDALDYVSKSQYWRRLWIVQELLLAREIVILCGAGCVDLKKLKWLENALRRRTGVVVQDMHAPPVQFARYIGKILHMKEPDVDKREFELGRLLTKFGFSRCSNIMDRIYGLLAIMEKPSTCSQPIVVDYQLSTYELAKQSVEYLNGHGETLPSMVSRLLEALDIGLQDINVYNLLLERRSKTSENDGIDANVQICGRRNRSWPSDERPDANPNVCLEMDIMGHSVIRLKASEDNGAISDSFWKPSDVHPDAFDNEATLRTARGFVPAPFHHYT